MAKMPHEYFLYEYLPNNIFGQIKEKDLNCFNIKEF